VQTATLLFLLLMANPDAAAATTQAEADAVIVRTAFGPVFVTPSVPEGHYGERFDGEAYWLPGVDESTSLVRKVIRSARHKRDAGERVALRSLVVENRRVFVTDDAPFPGVFWLRVGDAHAWIAGVEKPLRADVAALEAAAAALGARIPEVGAAPPR
jgi:hypothetical protein